jgi:hypothetical protein
MIHLWMSGYHSTTASYAVRGHGRFTRAATWASGSVPTLSCSESAYLEGLMMGLARFVEVASVCTVTPDRSLAVRASEVRGG